MMSWWEIRSSTELGRYFSTHMAFLAKLASTPTVAPFTLPFPLSLPAPLSTSIGAISVIGALLHVRANALMHNCLRGRVRQQSMVSPKLRPRTWRGEPRQLSHLPRVFRQSKWAGPALGMLVVGILSGMYYTQLDPISYWVFHPLGGLPSYRSRPPSSENREIWNIPPAVLNNEAMKYGTRFDARSTTPLNLKVSNLPSDYVVYDTAVEIANQDSGHVCATSVPHEEDFDKYLGTRIRPQDVRSTTQYELDPDGRPFISVDPFKLELSFSPYASNCSLRLMKGEVPSDIPLQPEWIVLSGSPPDPIDISDLSYWANWAFLVCPKGHPTTRKAGRAVDHSIGWTPRDEELVAWRKKRWEQVREHLPSELNAEEEDPRMNIAVLLLDSIGRHTWDKFFPKSIAVLEDVDATSETEVYKMEHFHSIGFNSVPTQTPMNLGANLYRSGTGVYARQWNALGFDVDLDGASDVKLGHDSVAANKRHSWIWDMVQDLGYIVGVGYEVLPEIKKHPGCTHWESICTNPHTTLSRWFWRPHPPADTQYPARLLRDWSDLFYDEIGYTVPSCTGKRLTGLLCTGQKSSELSFAEWTESVFTTYPDVPKFVYSAFQSGHIDKPAKHLTTLDDTLSKFLKEFIAKHGHDTVILLVADHGLAFGEYSASPTGFADHRLPMMHWILPSKWLDRAQEMDPSAPDPRAALRSFSETLSTPYDIYASMTQIPLFPYFLSDRLTAQYEEFQSHARSMFWKPQSKTRSCAEGHIPTDWCGCVSYEDVEFDPSVHQRLLDELKRSSDEVLRKAGVLGGKCLPFEIGQMTVFQSRPMNRPANEIHPEEKFLGTAYLVQFSGAQGMREEPSKWMAVVMDPADDPTPYVISLDQVTSYGPHIGKCNLPASLAHDTEVLTLCIC